MTADVLLAELEARGVILYRIGEKLSARPKHACEDLIEHIREHKAALLATVPWDRGSDMVRIRSTVLNGAEIYLAGDAATVPPQVNNLPVYTCSEIRKLTGLSPESLRLVHETKTVFGGTIES